MQTALYESQAKQALYDALGKQPLLVEMSALGQLDGAQQREPWLLERSLVVKPDLLMGKRGKNGLIALDKSWDEVRAWIQEKWDQAITIDGKSTRLNHLIIEPYIAHVQSEEYYFCIKTEAEKDVMLLSTQGGVEIEDNWEKIKTFAVDLNAGWNDVEFNSFIREYFSDSGFDSDAFRAFAKRIYGFFLEYGFVYIEINPLVIKDDEMFVVDVKSRVDSAEEWRKGEVWGKYLTRYNVQHTTNELHVADELVKQSEERVAYLDSLTGASLKMKVLNANGSVWPLVAGGGASVLIADAVVARGLGSELGFYGEYSGNPDQDLVEEYASQIISLMLAAKTQKRKTLLIAGGIANFTDVAKTFTGIIHALKKNHEALRKQNVRVLVRRGGPNYQKGLPLMKDALDQMQLDNEVHGPEVGLTDIVNKV